MMDPDTILNHAEKILILILLLAVLAHLKKISRLTKLLSTAVAQLNLNRSEDSKGLIDPKKDLGGDLEIRSSENVNSKDGDFVLTIDDEVGNFSLLQKFAKNMLCYYSGMRI